MADKRMKAVVEYDDAEDGNSEEGEKEDSDDLELGLSLAHSEIRAGFMGGGQMEGHSRKNLPWEDQGVGCSQFGSPLEPLRQFDFGQGNVKDWVEMNDCREDVVEVGSVSQVNYVSRDICLEMSNSECQRFAQQKRRKVLASPEDATFFLAEVTAAAVAIDFIPLSSSYSVEDKKAYHLSIFSSDDAFVKSSNTIDGVGFDGDTITAISAKNVEFRMDFSDDLLHLIFSFLEQKDLCRAGATCKQWLAASTHENFWRCLEFENIRISQQNFVAICHRYPNATEVKLRGTRNVEGLVIVAMTSLRHLETLILDKGRHSESFFLSEAFFLTLTDCPALTTLRISDAFISNCTQEVTVCHEKLHDLQLVKYRALRITVRCPQLQTLSLKRSSMAHVLLNCPQLRVLDLSSCHKLPDTAIRSSAMSCPLLTSLNMSSCLCVTDETIREISFTCPNLCILDASNCPNISFESVTLPMLMDLRLESCEAITSASISAISQSQMLKSLELYNCGMLTSVSLDLPHLQNISLVYLRRFVDLNLRSPVLKQIKVSRCSALHRISITSNALQKLVLQKQESLTTLLLQCQNLQEMDLSDCESLMDSICEVFSDGGGCPKLRSLVLDNCERLSMVKISSCTLVYLSLAWCHAMNVIELSCPNLEELNLDGCDHLESASFCSVGLELLNLGICPRLSDLRIEAQNMLVLDLKGCGVLSQAYIHCPRLKVLDASFCRKFSDESLSTIAASCPHIESLILSSCQSVGPNGLSSLHFLRRLTLLDLSYTFFMSLRPVFDNCLQLVVLKLSACKYLTDFSLDALYKEDVLPALRELDLSYSSIGQLDILNLITYCTNLVHLNLNGCANINELIWSSSYCHSSNMAINNCSSAISKENDESFRKTGHLLQILNCTGCPNIKKVLISSSANCLRLSKINLNLSINLKEVYLTCTNLCMLNLSYCSSLVILRLNCPRLNNLQLLACSMLTEEALEDAISQCQELEIINIFSCSKILAKDFDRWRMVCPSLRRIQSSL
ncbi:F-box/LRR-repeat protein 15-like [Musa acuminata AAA Group]|uniref:F-box/LRR-repeat protein 15-like n=1 Tax=Musa acuminata AAA Group TaxID=214697 RepID=UPI0031E49863